MSLAINVNHVIAVLLSDGWHEVANNSFTLDSYEYQDGEDTAEHDAFLLHGGGNSGVCATGFIFEGPDGIQIAGPLTAIQAVQQRRRPRSV